MQTSTSCLVPSDGHRNHDGYIRVLDKPRSEGGRLVMLHRLEWEKVNGPIPDGHNINHKCKNRECANVNHLEVLTLSEHAALDNSTRYRDKEQELVAYIMLNPDLSQEQIAQDMGVSQSTVCKTAQRKIQDG